MIRVFDFKMEGAPVLKVASLSFNQSEKFVTESRELLKRDKEKEEGKGEGVSREEWNKREHDTVLDALQRGGNADLTLDKLKEEFDIPTLNAIYLFTLEKSGLRPTGTPKVNDEGEAKAALTLAKSEAA